MIKFGICDDSQVYLEHLKETVLSTFYEYSTLGEEAECILYDSGKRMEELFAQDEPDVVILDIELEDGKLGMDVARHLCRLKQDVAIIYMTNHENDISKALVCRPLGFIRKQHITEDIKLPMMEAIEYLEQKQKVITFKHNSKDFPVNIRKVYAIEVYIHELSIYLDEQQIRIKDQLTHHIEELIQYGFVMVRRGVMINVRFIKTITDTDVELIDGQIYDISKDRMGFVKQQWMYYKMM